MRAYAESRISGSLRSCEATYANWSSSAFERSRFARACSSSDSAALRSLMSNTCATADRGGSSVSSNDTVSQTQIQLPSLRRFRFSIP